jgi:hypothetical protein
LTLVYPTQEGSILEGAPLGQALAFVANIGLFDVFVSGEEKKFNTIDTRTSRGVSSSECPALSSRQVRKQMAGKN